MEREPYYYSGYGYLEYNPDLNDSYDMETGKEIYIPSYYPFVIPKVYIKGWCECNDPGMESIFTIRDNIVTEFKCYDCITREWGIIEYNLDTLKKGKYNVKLESVSEMNLDDYYYLQDYIDPNTIKKFDLKKDTSPSFKYFI